MPLPPSCACDFQAKVWSQGVCLNIYYYRQSQAFPCEVDDCFCFFWRKKKGIFTECVLQEIATPVLILTCIFSGDRERPHVTLYWESNLDPRSFKRVEHLGGDWWMRLVILSVHIFQNTVNPIAHWKHAQKTIAVRHWNEWKSQGKSLGG